MFNNNNNSNNNHNNNNNINRKTMVNRNQVNALNTNSKEDVPHTANVRTRIAQVLTASLIIFVIIMLHLALLILRHGRPMLEDWLIARFVRASFGFFSRISDFSWSTWYSH